MTCYTEIELVGPALTALSESPEGYLETAQLQVLLKDIMNPTGEDAELLSPPRSDTKFSQKVRNLVSHRNSSNGMEALGLARYDSELQGWHITDIGRHHVAELSMV